MSDEQVWTRDRTISFSFHSSLPALVRCNRFQHFLAVYSDCSGTCCTHAHTIVRWQSDLLNTKEIIHVLPVCDKLCLTNKGILQKRADLETLRNYALSNWVQRLGEWRWNVNIITESSQFTFQANCGIIPIHAITKTIAEKTWVHYILYL